jgi:hypothetical protein
MSAGVCTVQCVICKLSGFGTYVEVVLVYEGLSCIGQAGDWIICHV